MTFHISALVLGFLLDLAFGDPRWLYHPIRLIGNLIAWAEKPFRAAFPKSEKGELAAGTFFRGLCRGRVHGSSGDPFSSGLKAVLLARLCPGGILEFSNSGGQIPEVGEHEGLRGPEGRRSFGGQEGSLHDRGPGYAEPFGGRGGKGSGGDGGGKFVRRRHRPASFPGPRRPGAGFFYKAVNTLDSMVGYKNDTYLYFGRFSAKLDDVLNFIPSRISGLLLVLASPLAGLSMEGAWKIFRRDRRNHASPNSAQTEAAAAGALGVQLAGDAYYFGKLYKKPTIGDPLRSWSTRTSAGKPPDVRGRLPGPCAGGAGGGSREPVVPDLGSALSLRPLCERRR